MKNLKLLSATLVSGLFLACNSSTPQQKAEGQSEKYEEKAYDAANQANSAAAIATDKTVESIIYADMAAVNNAVSQVPMPTLSNKDATNLCTQLGKSIVNRINASDDKQVASTQKEILKEKTNVEKALIDKKITEEDKNSIFKYADDCMAAANSI